jgi:hypothetical protein
VVQLSPIPLCPVAPGHQSARRCVGGITPVVTLSPTPVTVRLSVLPAPPSPPSCAMGDTSKGGTWLAWWKVSPVESLVVRRPCVADIDAPGPVILGSAPLLPVLSPVLWLDHVVTIVVHHATLVPALTLPAPLRSRYLAPVGTGTVGCRALTMPTPGSPPRSSPRA